MRGRHSLFRFLGQMGHGARPIHRGREGVGTPGPAPRGLRHAGREQRASLRGVVFHHNGEPIGDFRKAWATGCKKADVGGRLFHDLRRTAARDMPEAGVPQAVAMKITGHRTDSMFRRHAIVNEEQKREALAKVQKHLEESPAREAV